MLLHRFGRSSPSLGGSPGLRSNAVLNQHSNNGLTGLLIRHFLNRHFHHRPPLRIFRFGISTILQQKSHHIRPLLNNGAPQNRTAVLIHGVHIGSGLDQNLGGFRGFRLLAGNGFHQRSPAAKHRIDINSGIHQHLKRISHTCSAEREDGRVFFAFVQGDVRIRTGKNQLLEKLLVEILRSLGIEETFAKLLIVISFRDTLRFKGRSSLLGKRLLLIAARHQKA